MNKSPHDHPAGRERVVDPADVLPSAVALDGEIDEAFAALRRGWSMLQAVSDRGDLLALGPDRLIAMARRLEAHRAQLVAVDCGVVEAAREEMLHTRTRASSTAGALAEVLLISRGEANARVARAEQLGPRDGFSAGPLDSELPALTAAVREGAVSVDQVREIGTAMRQLRHNRDVDYDTLHEAEVALVEHARAFGPNELRTIGQKLYDALVPDGRAPREELARARRGITIGPQRRDGTHEIAGSITRSLRAQLHAVLSPLAAPRPDSDGAGPDTRSYGQRTHDALEDACRRLLDSGTLPASGGTAATVHLIVRAEELTDAVQRHRPAEPSSRAVARTALGDRVTLEEFLRLAEQADLIPTYLNATGGIIAHGRVRRCASASQTQALITRDGGCSFPSCTVPPEWCQRHHITPWARGGLTDIDNLTLVCGYHHREFERNGWRVVMIGGVPAWIPPPWIDPDQKPVTNARTTTTALDTDTPEAQALLATARASSTTDHDNHDSRGDPAGRGDSRDGTSSRFGSASSAGTGDSLGAGVQCREGQDWAEIDARERIEALLTELALHITDPSEREEFRYDLDHVLIAYRDTQAATSTFTTAA